MKFFTKVLFTLLLLVVPGMVGLYILLLSHWGANWISHRISDNTAYQLRIDKIDHRLSDPSHLLLNDVTFGYKGQQPLLTAKHVDLDLGLIQWITPLHFRGIHLKDGTLTLSDQQTPLPLSADNLTFSQMEIENSQYKLPVKAQQVAGAVTPWKPLADNVAGDNTHFQFSASNVTLAELTGRNLLLEGKLTDHEFTLTKVGVDLERGALTGSAMLGVTGLLINYD